MQKLIEKYSQLISLEKDIYQRDIFESFVLDGRIMGIVGPRGIGKTTFLLEYAKKNYPDSDKALYVSADDPYFLHKTLVDVAQKFIHDYDGQLLFIDEIHKYKNWNQELKNIYDFMPQLKVIFSGSSSMDLIKGKYDLSRRAILYHLNGFSFREFLEYKLKIKLEKYSLDELIENHLRLAKKFLKLPKILGHFKEYLHIGYYPFAFEFKKFENIYQALLNIIDKTIYEDIAAFYSLKTENLITFKKLLFWLATSSPGEINVNKLAQSLSKDNKTILEYLHILNQLGLVSFLLNNKKGHSFVRGLEKIYLDNSVLLSAINNHLGKSIEIGSTREIFAYNQLINADYKIFYTPHGDITAGKYSFEIGGKNKTRKQIKDIEQAYLLLDDITIGSSKTLPLYLLGLLY